MYERLVAPLIGREFRSHWKRIRVGSVDHRPGVARTVRVKRATPRTVGGRLLRRVARTTREVGSEVAVADAPLSSVAVTCTEIRWSRSSLPNRYDAAVAPRTGSPSRSHA